MYRHIYNKSAIFLLFMAALTTSISLPVRAQPENFCKIPQSNRSLVSEPVTDLDAKITEGMRSLNLEQGEVVQILWAKGTQNYEIKSDGSFKSFGPSANLSK